MIKKGPKETARGREGINARPDPLRRFYGEKRPTIGRLNVFALPAQPSGFLLSFRFGQLLPVRIRPEPKRPEKAIGPGAGSNVLTAVADTFEAMLSDRLQRR